MPLYNYMHTPDLALFFYQIFIGRTYFLGEQLFSLAVLSNRRVVYLSLSIMWLHLIAKTASFVTIVK